MGRGHERDLTSIDRSEPRTGSTAWGEQSRDIGVDDDPHRRRGVLLSSPAAARRATLSPDGITLGPHQRHPSRLRLALATLLSPWRRTASVPSVDLCGGSAPDAGRRSHGRQLNRAKATADVAIMTDTG